MGIGRHVPVFRCGCASCLIPLGRFFHDLCSTWFNGIALLVGVWVLSIVMAAELRPLAEKLQDVQLAFASYTLGFVCVVSSCFHSYRLSKQQCSCRDLPTGNAAEGRRDDTGLEPEQL